MQWRGGIVLIWAKTYLLFCSTLDSRARLRRCQWSQSLLDRLCWLGGVLAEIHRGNENSLINCIVSHPHLRLRFPTVAPKGGKGLQVSGPRMQGMADGSHRMQRPVAAPDVPHSQMSSELRAYSTCAPFQVVAEAHAMMLQTVHESRAASAMTGLVVL